MRAASRVPGNSSNRCREFSDSTWQFQSHAPNPGRADPDFVVDIINNNNNNLNSKMPRGGTSAGPTAHSPRSNAGPAPIVLLRPLQQPRRPAPRMPQTAIVGHSAGIQHDVRDLAALSNGGRQVEGLNGHADSIDAVTLHQQIRQIDERLESLKQRARATRSFREQQSLKADIRNLQALQVKSAIAALAERGSHGQIRTIRERMEKVKAMQAAQQGHNAASGTAKDSKRHAKPWRSRKAGTENENGTQCQRRPQRDQYDQRRHHSRKHQAPHNHRRTVVERTDAGSDEQHSLARILKHIGKGDGENVQTVASNPVAVSRLQPSSIHVNSASSQTAPVKTVTEVHEALPQTVPGKVRSTGFSLDDATDSEGNHAFTGAQTEFDQRPRSSGRFRPRSANHTMAGGSRHFTTQGQNRRFAEKTERPSPFAQEHAIKVTGPTRESDTVVKPASVDQQVLARSNKQCSVLSSRELHRPNADGWPPLINALLTHDIESFCELLEQGADPNQPASAHTVAGDQATPLHIAATLGMVDAVETLLLDALADPRITLPDGQTFLHCAVSACQLEVVQLVEDLLLPSFVDTDEDGTKYFTYKHAAWLRESAGTCTTRGRCETALHTATRCTLSEPLVAVLCSLPGLRVEATDRLGRTALDIVLAREKQCRAGTKSSGLLPVQRRKALAAYEGMRNTLQRSLLDAGFSDMTHESEKMDTTPTPTASPPGVNSDMSISRRTSADALSPSGHRLMIPPSASPSSESEASFDARWRRNRTVFPSSGKISQSPDDIPSTLASSRRRNSSVSSLCYDGIEFGAVDEDGIHQSDLEDSASFQGGVVQHQENTGSPSSIYRYRRPRSSLGIIKRALGHDWYIDGGVTGRFERDDNSNLKATERAVPSSEDRSEVVEAAGAPLPRWTDDSVRERKFIIREANKPTESVNGNDNDNDTGIHVSQKGSARNAELTAPCQVLHHRRRSSHMRKSSSGSSHVEGKVAGATASFLSKKPSTKSKDARDADDEDRIVRSRRRSSAQKPLRASLKVDSHLVPPPLSKKRSLGGHLIGMESSDSEESDFQGDDRSDEASDMHKSAEPNEPRIDDDVGHTDENDDDSDNDMPNPVGPSDDSKSPDELPVPANSSNEDGSNNDMGAGSDGPDDSDREYADTDEEDTRNTDVESPATKAEAETETEEVLAEMAAKKKHVVAELVSSQRKYVQHLEMLRDGFQRPLQQEAKTGKNPNFGMANYAMLFANLDAIINLDTKFRDDLVLEAKKSEMDERSIGRVVCEFVDYFKLYSDYCNAHEKSTRSLKKLAKKPKFRTLLENLSTNPMLKGFSIDSLLITPIQRLPRLKMLLEELLSCTGTQDPERERLDKAAKQISQVTQKVNDTIGERANRLKVFEIQQCLRRFNGELVAAHRVYLREGELDKACRRGIVKARYCFLFSDLFIYTRKAGKGLYDYKHSLHVRRVEELSQQGGGSSSEGGSSPRRKKTNFSADQISRGFKLFADERDAVFFAPSSAMCKEWVRSIRRIVDVKNRSSARLRAAGRKVVQQVKDKRSLGCSACERQFGFFRRMHICSVCNRQVCGGCSTGRVVRRSIRRVITQRVCKQCQSDMRKTGSADGDDFEDVSSVVSRELDSGGGGASK